MTADHSEAESVMSSMKLFSARAVTAPAAVADPTVTRRAFALVSLSHPRLSYAGWVRFLRRASRGGSGRSGVVFVEDPRGYPHAFFRYSVEAGASLAAAESGSGRVMRLSDLVVGEIPGSDLLTRIAERGEELARASGCASLVIELPRAMRLGAPSLAGYHAVAGGLMAKAL